MRIRPFLPIVLAAAIAVLAPTALAATPKADELLKRSAAALNKKDTLHLDLELGTTAKTDGTLTAAQVRKLVPPVKISARGDLSPSAVVFAGKLDTGGQALAAELRLSGKEIYVNLFGAWYGTKDVDAKDGNGINLNVKPKELTGSLRELLASGFEAKVDPGPEADGVETWKLTGSFDGPTLAKALKSTGATTNAKAVSRLAEKADVTILIGREDDLPRRIEISTTLSGSDLTTASSTTQGLVPLPKSGTKGLKAVTVSIVVQLSKFGQKVAFERPAKFKPLDKLFEALLGGIGGATTTTK